MMRPLCLLLISGLAGLARAGELTVQPAPFRLEQTFEAEIVPAQAESWQLEPEQWEKFVITELAEHGQAVKKGDTLIAFEREAYAQQLEDLRRTVAIAASALERQRTVVAQLERSQALALTAAQRSARHAQQDLDEFRKTGRPAAERRLDASLTRARFGLESAKEELRQLKLMYEADDLTEDTEEIILERQRIAVEMAEVQLAEAEREARLEREVALPRREQALEQEALRTALALEGVESSQPRELAEARLALAGQESALARQQEKLAELESDDRWFEWQAPAAGLCYHGELGPEGWQLGDLVKVLKPGGSVPQRTGLVSLVPAQPPLQLYASVDPATARHLQPQSKVSVAGWEHDRVATITALQPALDPGRRVGLTLSAEFPADSRPPLGSRWTCRYLAYAAPEALAIPRQALMATADGRWMVEVRLADGGTEIRPVQLGAATEKSVEVVDGLEAGQVVLLPE